MCTTSDKDPTSAPHKYMSLRTLRDLLQREAGKRNQSSKRILENDFVKTYVGHMCAFGMYQERKDGIKLVKKPTKFMTNADKIGQELSEKCSGDHEHVHLVNEGQSALKCILTICATES